MNRVRFGIKSPTWFFHGFIKSTVKYLRCMYLFLLRHQHIKMYHEDRNYIQGEMYVSFPGNIDGLKLVHQFPSRLTAIVLLDLKKVKCKQINHVNKIIHNLPGKTFQLQEVWSSGGWQKLCQILSFRFLIKSLCLCEL